MRRADATGIMLIGCAIMAIGMATRNSIVTIIGFASLIWIGPKVITGVIIPLLKILAPKK